jgi:hypothetical protein
VPFVLKDETANVFVLYIDNAGLIGLMGSANPDQALSFAGVGVITSGAYMANGIAKPGAPSPLTGTIVIPVNASGSVTYSLPQIPTVNADSDPTSVSTTETVFTNTSTTSSVTYNYKIW